LDKEDTREHTRKLSRVTHNSALTGAATLAMLRSTMPPAGKTPSSPRFPQSLFPAARFLFVLFSASSCEKAPDLDKPPPVVMKDPNLGPDEIPLQIEKRCPGAEGCADTSDDALYVGYAARDITPQVETFTDLDKNGVWDPGEPFVDENKNGVFDAYWLAGFSSGRLAYGVADPVWARAIAIKQNQTTVVLVSVDTLGLFHEENQAVEKMIDPRLGVDLLMVHATHVHEAPDLTGGWGPNPFTWGVNEGYQKLVRKLIAEAVTDAVQGVKPARLTASAIKVEDSNRDMNRYVADSRDPVVIDNTLHTLHFVERDAVPPRPITTLVNWANHPEASGSSNHYITSDFVHHLRDKLEKSGAGPVVYVSGAIGGLLTPLSAVPHDEMGQPVKENGLPKAKATGLEVARFALEALADPNAKTVEGKAARLSFRTTVFKTHIENIKYQLASMIGVFRRSFCCYDESRPIDDTNAPQVETKVAYIQIGPVSIITNPGELAGELFIGGYGGEYAGTYRFIDLTQKNPPDVSKAPKPPYLVDVMDGPRQHRMTFGLTMDFLGYIVPRYNFVLSDKSPYFDEAEGDHYEETNSIGPYAEPQIVGSLRQLVLDGRPNVAR
jgi:hypothetical protein